MKVFLNQWHIQYLNITFIHYDEEISTVPIDVDSCINIFVLKFEI